MEIREPFNVNGKDIFLDILASGKAGIAAWTVAGLGIAVALWGCVSGDLRFLALGLLVCLAVVPAILVFLYFYNLLSDGVVYNILPHTIERASGGYVVTVFRKDEESEENDGERDGAVRWVECAKATVPDSSVVKIRKIAGYEVLCLADAPLKLLYIPLIR